MGTRVYMTIHANTTGAPTEQQWRDLVSAAKDKPLAEAVLAAATGRGAEKRISAHKRNLGTDAMRYTLAGFEIDDSEIAGVAAVVNAEATRRGISAPTLAARFIAVLEAELQEAATDLGYGAQASNLTIPWYDYGDRYDAINAVQTYLADNSATWAAF